MTKVRLEARSDHPSRGPSLREPAPKPEPELEPKPFAMPRGLAALLVLLLVFSCTSGVAHNHPPVVPSSVIELGPSERAEEQRRSLTHVFYRNNAAPPTPSARELRRLERDLEKAPPVEVRELHDLFGNDLELLAYATRDTDGDGVLDFRISEYRGKFFEGDTDVDGDGIRNVYDAAPYNRRIGGTDTTGDGIPDKPGSFADRDGDGIPDHLDWSRRKAEPMPAIQAGLFHDYDVMLVERSARYTPELAQAVDDTMRFVFRESIDTLRTIAAEDQLLISPDLGDNGFMLGQTQTLTICVGSIKGAPPLVVLGLVVHEVGHAWQLAHDFDAGNLLAENKKMHFPPGDFTGSLERFGWEVDTNSIGEGYHHRLYWPHFYATSPRYLYRGYAPNEWATWFEDVQREAGPEFLRDSPAATWGMIGPYSLTSPWEWHADHLMASIYNRIDRGVLEHPNHTYRGVAPLLSERMLDTVQHQWNRFDYRNAIGTGIDRDLSRTFDLDPEDVQTLVDRYVIPLVDLPMIAEAFAFEPAPPTGIAAVTEGFGDVWGDVRQHVAQPLRRMPSLNSLAQAGTVPWRDTPKPTNKTTSTTTTTSEDEGESTADSAGPEQPALAPATGPEPHPTRVRSAFEHVKDAQLGSRHGAGQVGGLVCDPAQAQSVDLPTRALDTPEPTLPAAPEDPTQDPIDDDPTSAAHTPADESASAPAPAHESAPAPADESAATDDESEIHALAEPRPLAEPAASSFPEQPTRALSEHATNAAIASILGELREGISASASRLKAPSDPGSVALAPSLVEPGLATGCTSDDF